VQSYEIPENIDLADFCFLLMQNAGVDAGIKAACKKVVDAVTGKSGMVVKSGCKGASVKDSHGLAIYFPTMNISPLYAKLDLTKKSGWGTFLGKYLAAAKSR